MKIIKYLSIAALVLFLFFVVNLFLGIRQNFGYPTKLFFHTITSAYQQSKKLPDSINMLLLGADPRSDWLEQNEDTDTIILASLNFKKPSLTLISIPRDLWDTKLGSRVNKIYSTSLKNPNSFQFIKERFHEITGQSIDHIIVVTTDILVDLLDIVGPVEINLPSAFTDDQYPNPQYIADPVGNPDKYITISFAEGPNTIDSANVSYFVKSRKSTDSTDNGSDIGRSYRQQLLLTEIINKFKTASFWRDQKLSKLYFLWSRKVIKDIPDQSLFAIIFKLSTRIFHLNIKQISLPIGKNVDDTFAVLYHPPSFKNNAWVFLPIKNDYQFISKYIDSQLN